METLLTRMAKRVEEYKPRRVVETNPLLLELNSGRPPSESQAERLARLKELAESMPARPMKGSRYVVAYRRNGKWFFRKSPKPSNSPAKKKTLNKFAELTKLASQMSYEEVAALVGGQVVDVGKYLKRPELVGKTGILVDGQVLTKAQAILKLMKGKKFAKQRSRLDKILDMLEELMGVSR